MVIMVYDFTYYPIKFYSVHLLRRFLNSVLEYIFSLLLHAINIHYLIKINDTKY